MSFRQNNLIEMPYIPAIIFPAHIHPYSRPAHRPEKSYTSDTHKKSPCRPSKLRRPAGLLSAFFRTNSASCKNRPPALTSLFRWDSFSIPFGSVPLRRKALPASFRIRDRAALSQWQPDKMHQRQAGSKYHRRQTSVRTSNMPLYPFQSGTIPAVFSSFPLLPYPFSSIRRPCVVRMPSSFIFLNSLIIALRSTAR